MRNGTHTKVCDGESTRKEQKVRESTRKEQKVREAVPIPAVASASVFHSADGGGS